MKAISDAGRAVAQMGDPTFRRVLATGIGLTVALLAAFIAIFVWMLDWLIPDRFTLPWIGEVTWIDNAVSWSSVPLLLFVSTFLMIPVASAFTSLFLDDVTDAVEARHYPELPPAPRLSFLQGLGDGFKFLGVLILANIAAFAAYLMLPPAAPFIFFALNGYLLGREYFQLIAARRLGFAGARRLRRRYAAQIWLAGCLMAVPLVVPILGLLVPVLGAATFTHLFHRLPVPDRAGRTSRGSRR
ncbi:EI24 domain-containing protein [Palleronia sp. LCG004]|uniref:EI24 domain-containing protein n=1 Tax=Palleronia sp. LCG004 TaxID=3079304 RepID=UPI002942224F|nr:EI24 domain-containing protein [Palleronia sp. LCG004]WOI57423.1 EI24 domain-containing protein [Palleronia sp. LCG004]